MRRHVKIIDIPSEKAIRCKTSWVKGEKLAYDCFACSHIEIRSDAKGKLLIRYKIATIGNICN